MPDDEELVQPVTREIENAGELLHFWRRFALHARANILAGDRQEIAAYLGGHSN